MASVAVVYAVRRLTSRVALECYAIGLSLIGITTLVSMGNVYGNFRDAAARGFDQLGVFVLSAVTATDVWVQAMLLLGACAFLLLLADLFRSASASRNYLAR